MRSSRLRLKEVLATGPLVGREGEDDDAGDGVNGATDAGGSGDEGGDEDEDDAGGSGDDDLDLKKERSRAAARERQRLAKAAKDAAAENKSLKEQLEAFTRKDKSELENAKTDLDKTTNENKTLKERLSKLAIDNAFLQVNNIQWHNPKRALQMADLSEVEIDDDGNVDEKALQAAMKKLADEEPYLVKSGKDDDEEEDEKDQRQVERTGTPSSGSTKKRKREADQRAILMQNYPSLRQHVG